MYLFAVKLRITIKSIATPIPQVALVPLLFNLQRFLLDIEHNGRRAFYSVTRRRQVGPSFDFASDNAISFLIFH